MRPEHFILNHMLNRRNGIKTDLSVPSETVWAKPTERPHYSDVLPSSGLRKPSLKSPKNYRGTQPSLDGQRIMYFESGVELKGGRIFRTSPDVVELREQWPKIHYIGSDGRRHYHIFDYWVCLKCGTRIAIAAKPLEVLIKTGTLQILRLIQRMGIPQYADKVTFMTEHFATDEADANAAWILVSRKKYNEEEFYLAYAMVERLTGTVRFYDLLREAPVVGHRRTAIWNLIDAGVLMPVHPGRIDDNSLLISTLD